MALLIDCMAQVIGALFNGLERMELGAIIIIVQEVAFLLFGGTVLLIGLPFLWLFVVYVPSRLAGLLVALVLYRRVAGQPLRFRFDPRFAAFLLRNAAPYAANMALGPVYLRIDVLMLSYYQGSVAVGLYEAAATIFYRFNILARMFNNALMPLMAREYETEAKRIRKYVNAAAKYQVALGIPLTLLCLFLGRQLITAVYGPSFAGAGIVFTLLATIITLRFLDNTLATTLTAVNMQSYRSLIVAFAAVINIALNLYMIPRYSFLGAAISTIVTEICFCVGLYIVLSRRIKQPLAKVFLPQIGKKKIAGISAE
ncbi:MAG: flippase [Chloroflexi bacterium]|nr:flippase [Chloroflexota bacterium]